MFNNEEKGLFATIMSTTKGVFKAADKGVSVVNELAGTAEELAKTARVLAEQNRAYVTTKSKAKHDARMDDLNDRIAANKRLIEQRQLEADIAAKRLLAEQQAEPVVTTTIAPAPAPAVVPVKAEPEVDVADEAFGDKKG